MGETGDQTKVGGAVRTLNKIITLIKHQTKFPKYSMSLLRIMV